MNRCTRMTLSKPLFLLPRKYYLTSPAAGWFGRSLSQLFYRTSERISCRGFSSNERESSTATHTVTSPKDFNEVPGPKGGARLPLIGPAFLFKPFTSHEPARMDLLTIDLHRKYGKIVRILLPFGETVLLSDPHDMLTVFQNEGKYPRRPNFGIVDTYFKSRNIKTLSTMDGEEWHHLRMRVQPKFMRPAAADPYIPAIGFVADDLVTWIKNSNKDKDDDFRNTIFLYVLESLGQFCFNRRIGALTPGTEGPANETIDRVKDLFKVMASPPLLPLYKVWKTKTYKIVEESLDYLIGLSRKELSLALKEMKENKDRDQTNPHFIETLLAGSDLKEEEVAMSVSEFFFGGTDTTSRMLGLLLFHIARHPDQQQILYDEIKEVVGPGQVTREHLALMNFTKACVKESLRLVFPLAPGPPRFLPHDLVLAGYKVPKGTLAMLSNVAYLHDPECVQRPKEFLPQRWMRGEDRKKNENIPPVTFLPFGIGARMCLGKRFAEQMMYLCLIKLVQNFELSLKSDPSTLGIKYEAFPTTNKPLQIKFTPRI